MLAAFGGVVWLAYNQGVARGRADAPRIIAAPVGSREDRARENRAGARRPMPGLKIYNEPVPPEQEAQGTTEAPAPASEMPSEAPAAAPAEAAVPPRSTAASPAGTHHDAAGTCAVRPHRPAAEPAPAPRRPSRQERACCCRSAPIPTEASANAAWTSFQKKHAATLRAIGPT